MTRGALKKSWTACQNGDTYQVRELFGQLNSSEVQTLLERAVLHNSLEPASFLLEQGADLTIIPLFLIVDKCSIEMLRLLSEFKMNFHQRPEQNVLL